MSPFTGAEVIDSQDIIEFLESFEEEHEAILEAIAARPDDPELIKGLLELGDIDLDDYEEYKEAKRVDTECSGGDWTYGVTLIKDSYFEEYAKQLCEDIGDIPKDFPSYIEIDWGATAKNIQQDYSSVDIKGDTYWYRS